MAKSKRTKFVWRGWVLTSSHAGQPLQVKEYICIFYPGPEMKTALSSFGFLCTIFINEFMVRINMFYFFFYFYK